MFYFYLFVIALAINDEQKISPYVLQRPSDNFEHLYIMFFYISNFGFKCKTTILYNAYEYLTFSSMLLQNRPKFCTSFLLDCFDVLLHVSLMYVDIYSLQYFFPRKLVLRHARHYALQFAICISNLRIDE